jgi:hypothetical protein
MSPLSAQAAGDAWIDAYRACRADYPANDWNAMLAAGGTSDRFTSLVLNSRGVVDRAAGLLSERTGVVLSRAKGEPLRVDAAFFGPRTATAADRTHPEVGYAPLVMVLEHEKFDTWPSEMENLFRVRCRLKILVFYAWSNPKAARPPDQQQALVWNRRHLERKLNAMWARSDEQGFEDPRSEYLFILGHQPSHAADITWHRLVIAAQGGLIFNWAPPVVA